VIAVESCLRPGARYRTSWTTPPAIGWSTNTVGALLNGVSEKVLLRAFDYLRNVDKDYGDRVEQGVRAAPSSPPPPGRIRARNRRSRTPM
jgi:catalase